MGIATASSVAVPDFSSITTSEDLLKRIRGVLKSIESLVECQGQAMQVRQHVDLHRASNEARDFLVDLLQLPHVLQVLVRVPAARENDLLGIEKEKPSVKILIKKGN